MPNVSNRQRQPSGIPQGGEFKNEHKGLDADDLDVGTLTNRRFKDVDKEDMKLVWLDSLLQATVGEHAGEPVCQPEEETRMRRRMVGDEHHPGPLMQGLAKWFPDRAKCREVADREADRRIKGLRRSCVLDKTKCYSPSLVQHTLSQPVRAETTLAKEYGVTAHKQRVGVRYNKIIEAYALEHSGNIPPEEERDEIWDKVMVEFIAEKTAKGVTYGRGMAYSDGRNANPDMKTSRIRMWRPKTKDGKTDRKATPVPFNGRKDFEGLMKRFHEALKVDNPERDKTSNLTGGGNIGQVSMRSVYMTALDERMDADQLKILRERLGIADKDGEAWENEWAVTRLLS